jgi:hypothetical protein
MLSLLLPLLPLSVICCLPTWFCLFCHYLFLLYLLFFSSIRLVLFLSLVLFYLQYMYGLHLPCFVSNRVILALSSMIVLYLPFFSLFTLDHTVCCLNPPSFLYIRHGVSSPFLIFCLYPLCFVSIHRVSSLTSFWLLFGILCLYPFFIV